MTHLRRHNWLILWAACAFAQPVQALFFAPHIVGVAQNGDLNALSEVSGVVIILAKDASYDVQGPFVLRNCALIGNGATIHAVGSERPGDSVLNCTIELHDSSTLNLRVDVAGQNTIGVLAYGETRLYGTTEITGFTGKALSVNHDGTSGYGVYVESIRASTDKIPAGAEAIAVQFDAGSNPAGEIRVGQIICGELAGTTRNTHALKAAMYESLTIGHLDLGGHGLVFGEGCGPTTIKRLDGWRMAESVKFADSDEHYPLGQVLGLRFYPPPTWRKDNIKPWPELHIGFGEPRK